MSCGILVNVIVVENESTDRSLRAIRAIRVPCGVRQASAALETGPGDLVGPNSMLKQRIGRRGKGMYILPAIGCF